MCKEKNLYSSPKKIWGLGSKKTGIVKFKEISCTQVLPNRNTQEVFKTKEKSYSQVQRNSCTPGYSSPK